MRVSCRLYHHAGNSERLGFMWCSADSCSQSETPSKMSSTGLGSKPIHGCDRTEWLWMHQLSSCQSEKLQSISRYQQTSVSPQCPSSLPWCCWGCWLPFGPWPAPLPPPPPPDPCWPPAPSRSLRASPWAWTGRCPCRPRAGCPPRTRCCPGASGPGRTWPGPWCRSWAAGCTAGIRRYAGRTWVSGRRAAQHSGQLDRVGDNNLYCVRILCLDDSEHFDIFSFPRPTVLTFSLFAHLKVLKATSLNLKYYCLATHRTVLVI